MLRKSSAWAGVAALLSCWSGCTPRNQYIPPPPMAVTVAHPVGRPVNEYVEVTGTTRATARVDLRARVNGYLQSIEFADGATVKKGDLLFIIEPEPFRVRLDRAKAELEKAEASLDLAAAEVNRTANLVQRNAASRQELDVDKAERATAAASVASARTAVRDAELQLAYTEVRAPIGGQIGRHLVDVGNLVLAESTLLSTIESYDPLYVYFTISERQALYFTRLRQRKILPPRGSSPIVLHMGLGDEEGFPHEGLFDFAELGVDPETGTTQRRGTFPNPDRTIVPGLFVHVRAAVGDPRPRLLVPERAQGSDQKGRYVLVVNDQGVVERRSVTTGIEVDGLRVIEGGELKPDDWVVVNGLLRARPGAKVKPERGDALAFVSAREGQAPAATPVAAEGPGPSGDDGADRTAPAPEPEPDGK